MVVVFDYAKKQFVCKEGNEKNKILPAREVMGRMILDCTWNEDGNLVMELS